MRILIFLLVFAIPHATLIAAHFSKGVLSFDYDEKKWEISSETAKPAKAPASLKGTVVALEHKKAKDRYRARISVVEDKITKEKKQLSRPENYHRHSVEFLKSQRFRIISKGKTKLSGISQPVYETVASQRDFGLMTRQIVLSHQGKIYLLTASTRIDNFEEHKNEIARLFNSFRFKSTSSDS